MAYPLEHCTRYEQRSVIRFLRSEGVKPIDIPRGMELQYGNSCLSFEKVQEWSNKFKNGLNSVVDSHRPGQANRVVKPESISAVEVLVKENRRVILDEIAKILNMSRGSVHHIITRHNQIP